MNARQKALVDLILGSQQYRPLKLFAHLLGCSERTVRSDIASINALLEKAGLASRIRGKRGNGVRFDLRVEERPQVEGLLSEYVPRLDSRLERFCRGVLLLTLGSQTYSIDMLARLLYTNKKSLHEELPYWLSLLRPYGVRVLQQGAVSLVGKEEALRLGAMFAAYAFAPGALQRRLEREFFSDDLGFFEGTVERIERGLGLRLSHNARKQLVAYLTISLTRIAQGKILRPVVEPNPSTMPVFLAEERRFERHCGTAVPESELAFLSASIASYSRQWDERLIRDCRCSDEARALADELGRALLASFGRPLPSQLIKPLELLMDAVISHRLFSPMPLPNPNERMMKIQHMDKYLMLHEVIADNELLGAAGIAGADCARLAMLLVDYFEKAMPRRYRVGLVVNAGIEQAIFSEYRFKRLFPSIEIAAVLSEDEALSLERGAAGPGGRAAGGPDAPFDLLISFEPLDTAYPCVSVSASLSARDGARIASAMLGIENAGLALDDALSADEAPVVPGRSMHDLVEAMHGLLSSQQRYRGRPEELAALFENNATRLGDTLIVCGHHAPIVRSTAAFYSLGDFDEGFSSLALLLVSLEDRNRLPLLVESFKHLLATKAESGRIGAPPLALPDRLSLLDGLNDLDVSDIDWIDA